MKNIVENQGIKTDKPLAMSYEALKAERDAQQKRADELAVENAAMRHAITFATAPDMWIDKGYNHFEYRYQEWYVDVLNASAEIPATDAALAAIQAQGVEKLIKLKMEQLANMHPDTHAFGSTAESLRAQINELQAFAAELREAK
ncbi:hypothetical protein L7815_012135 [Serratia marcescens]|uniref:hypothetical protein n=1 Tax=Serratia marcescens TaxID=615 RepID=UPI001C3C0D7C|nr:hypothetical protein [Serratia marcescens]MCG5374685.1 hypothetical protein [Serratia marcescens]HBH6923214.1 hypothetical protein [Serratia marcescens]